MNPKKICIIMCVNDQHMLEEAMYYINRLRIPEGFTLDLLTVQDAESITSGYNEAMRSSDAKYKIYMHQDVFLIYSDILGALLDIFENPQIGMIGLFGTKKIPQNGIFWCGPLVGQILQNKICDTTLLSGSAPKEAWEEVAAIDGLFMATQYDIPWREDILNGWDFYDISQSLEFQNKGYRVAVPKSNTPWCLHAYALNNLSNYFGGRKILLENYKIS